MSEPAPQELLGVLLKLQDDYRKSALSKPTDKSEFGFGEAVGINKGLGMAIDKVIAMSKEEEDI